jgi:hypothetical protein
MGGDHGFRTARAGYRGCRKKLAARIEWDFTFGPQAEKIAKAAEAAGHPIPESCIPPDVGPALAFAYLAFHDLLNDRQIGYGALGPIIWSSIARYAESYDVSDIDDMEELATLIHAADDAYLAIVNKKTNI